MFVGFFFRPCGDHYRGQQGALSGAAAHDAASNGDTIYVNPSGVPYNAITVTKRLHIVGTGFDYPGEGMKTTLMTGTMTFSPGSDVSVLEGFGQGGDFSVSIDADDITVKKDRLKLIEVFENHVGAVIVQNYLFRSGDYSIIVHDYNEVMVSNNIIIDLMDTSFSADFNLGIGANSQNITITILNNVFYVKENQGYALRLNSSNHFVANNIIFIARCSGSEYYFNNMSDGAQLPVGNGNILNVDMTTVFVDPANYDFHLLPDSPAIGSGQNGVDMGIYGGSTPYVDGGRPGIPSIIQLESDHAGSQSEGLDVIIRAQSNRE